MGWVTQTKQLRGKYILISHYNTLHRHLCIYPDSKFSENKNCINKLGMHQLYLSIVNTPRNARHTDKWRG